MLAVQQYNCPADWASLPKRCIELNQRGHARVGMAQVLQHPNPYTYPYAHGAGEFGSVVEPVPAAEAGDLDDGLPATNHLGCRGISLMAPQPQPTFAEQCTALLFTTLKCTRGRYTQVD